MIARAIAVLVMGLLAVGCGSKATAPTTQVAQTRPATLEQRLDEVLGRHSATGAIYSARVVDLDSGKELYSRDAARQMIPASNMKVLVTASALDRLGIDHAFETHLALDGDDLWVIGTGDPACGDPRLAKAANEPVTAMFDVWAEALKKKGISHVSGNLYHYDGAFDRHLVHPSWSKSFLTDWYAAPVSGLNFHDNCVDITVKPRDAGAEQAPEAKYVLVPPARGITVLNQIGKGPTTAPSIERAAGADRFTLKGTVSRETALESKPVTDPGAFFADVMRTHLESKGIVIAGKTIRAEKPLAGMEGKRLAVHRTPMRKVLSRTNKNSQNLFAEALCKYLGRQVKLDQGIDVPGSWENGGEAVRAFLKKHAIDDSALVLADGSGLARLNRVSAKLMTDVLVLMDKKHGADYRDSLAVAGKDGTIGSRLKDIEGRVQAKTGFIGGVRSLSGYAQTRSGRRLAFSFLYNQIPGDVKPYEALQDEACRILVNE